MLKLGLGTVQWGTDYGIANRVGMAGVDTVSGILRLAKAAEVPILDTAAVYGAAEDVLGVQGAAALGFDIVTKTLPFRELEVSTTVAVQRVRERFLLSMEKLNVSSVYGLLVHHSTDLLGPEGEHLWKSLSDIRREGFARKIGCSLYNPEDLMEIMQRYDIDLIQVPLNVYDQRFLSSGVLAAAKARNIEIHTRSVFLQGLLLMEEADLPPFFDAIRAHQGRFHRECCDAGKSPLQAALEFVIQCGLVDKAIVGCESIAQCREILAVAKTAQNGTERVNTFSELALEDEIYINPGRW